MPEPESLIDRDALFKHRARIAAAPELFLHEACRDEVEDRLTLVNKQFKNPLVVTPYPNLWQNRMPDADVIQDTDVLGAERGAYDLVIHAMCLHWSNDPVGQLIQCRNALKPDGFFLCVGLGGQTLHELRAALGQAEIEVSGGLSPRVLPMGEVRDLGGLLQRAGFALPVADTLPLTASYVSAFHLMKDLRAMGETNALTQRLKSPTKRGVFLRAADIYDTQFADDRGRVTATFEFVLLTGWAPDKSQPQPLRPGSATQRLADALQAKETPLKD